MKKYCISWQNLGFVFHLTFWYGGRTVLMVSVTIMGSSVLVLVHTLTKFDLMAIGRALLQLCHADGAGFCSCVLSKLFLLCVFHSCILVKNCSFFFQFLYWTVYVFFYVVCQIELLCYALFCSVLPVFFHLLEKVAGPLRWGENSFVLGNFAMCIVVTTVSKMICFAILLS